MTVFSLFDRPWDGLCNASGVGGLPPSPPRLVSSLNNPLYATPSHARTPPTLSPFGPSPSVFSRFSPPLPPSPIRFPASVQSYSNSSTPPRYSLSSLIKDTCSLSSKDFHPSLDSSSLSQKVLSSHNVAKLNSSDLSSLGNFSASLHIESPSASCRPSVPPFLPSVLPSPRPCPLFPRCRSQLAHNSLPNAFRPPVPAALRLASWSSPYDLRTRALMASTHPPSVINDAYALVADSLSANTRSTYAAGVKRFNEFCDEKGISEEARMPASTITLTAFVKWASGRFSGNTIRSWLSGVRSWHILKHAHWNGDHEWITLARMAANKAGVDFKRPPRPPVSLEHLFELKRRIDISNSLDAAVWACVLIAEFCSAWVSFLDPSRSKCAVVSFTPFGTATWTPFRISSLLSQALRPLAARFPSTSRLALHSRRWFHFSETT
ncbi:hypothetical protein CVT25_013445 [Psilocybe cyanescens]|uniref:Core-binding (CB) domain-containing protein n=1 Tax=Psilocybe cyanescens TaxID=93625 RepID=A0A409WTB3_PSICY|nr:hypothetical protein CVT25_013445 [Psilocybe cyanescens]